MFFRTFAMHFHLQFLISNLQQSIYNFTRTNSERIANEPRNKNSYTALQYIALVFLILSFHYYYLHWSFIRIFISTNILWTFIQLKLFFFVLTLIFSIFHDWSASYTFFWPCGRLFQYFLKEFSCEYLQFIQKGLKNIEPFVNQSRGIYLNIHIDLSI